MPQMWLVSYWDNRIKTIVLHIDCKPRIIHGDLWLSAGHFDQRVCAMHQALTKLHVAGIRRR